MKTHIQAPDVLLRVHDHQISVAGFLGLDHALLVDQPRFFEELEDVPPFTSIEWVQFLQAPETDVVFFSVNNRPLVIANVEVQIAPGTGRVTFLMLERAFRGTNSILFS